MLTTYSSQSFFAKVFRIALFCCLGVTATAQVTGDYRSVATGNWSAIATWQYYNGSAWVAATKYPGQVSGDQTVTIQSPNVVTWDLASTPFQYQNLTVSAGGTLRDMAGAFSYLLQPNNLITVNGTMTMTNTTDLTAFVIAGNMNIGAAGIFSARNIGIGITDNNGTATITESMIGGGWWNNRNNSTLNFGGASITESLFATFSGNTVNYYSATVNQTIKTPSDSYYNLTLSGAGGMTKTLSAATTVKGTVSIQNNSVFSLGGFNLVVGGNWNNSSSAILTGISGTTVTFDGFGGSQQQNIINSGAAFGTYFYNLTINNPVGVSPAITLFHDVYVQNQLSMLQGNIDLGGNLLQLGINTATANSLNHSGSSGAGWVYNGFFKRIFQDGIIIADGSTNGLFPVGISSDFRPFYISSPAVSITNATILVKATTATNTTIVNIADTGGPIVRQHQGYWQVSSSATTGTYKINAGGTGFGMVANVNDLRLSLAASVVGSAGTNSGTNSFPMVQRTGLTAANLTNNFYMSSVEPVGSYLPVELVSFSAKVNGDVVNLEWQTLSELNSLQFNVFRSSNGVDFHLVGSMDGQGTTNKAHNYSMTDFSPAKGLNYYRLEQVATDLKATIIKTIVAEISSITPIKIYPNPINEGNAVNLDLNGLTPNVEKEIQVADLKGNLVLSQVITTDESGSFRGALNLQHLTSGLYIVSLDGVKSRIFIR